MRANLAVHSTLPKKLQKTVHLVPLWRCSPSGVRSLQLGDEGQPLVHVGFELGPLGHSLDGALLLTQHARRLLQLGLVTLQVAFALAFEEVELLHAVLVERDVLGHVGVEPEVGVRRQESVQHSVHL